MGHETIAMGWAALNRERDRLPQSHFAAIEAAYYQGAEGWVVALNVALSMGELPSASDDARTLCPYPGQNPRAWWWREGCRDAQAVFERSRIRTGLKAREIAARAGR